MKTTRLTAALVALAPVVPVSAQTASPAATAEVVQLSAFEVASAKDKGYSARDTVGASRIAIPIAELSQAIAVVNAEMLRDLAPNSLPEVTRYIGGVAETNSPGSDIFAIRGVPISSPFTDGLPEVGSSQGTGLDFSYFDRVEVLKGPSAVIYGSTSAGGVVNRVAKKPRFDRARTLLDLEAGSYDHYRGTLDANQPIGPGRTMALRLVGTYWSRQSAQNFDYGHRRFLAPMFAWRITPSTTAVVAITDYWDRYHKPWGQAFTLPPYVGNNLALSFALNLPRERAWAEPYSVQYEQGRRYNLSVEHKVNAHWSLKLAGFSSSYNYHESPTTILRDVVLVGGRYLMQRSWRYSANPVDSDTLALDSAWKFDLGPTRHTLIALAQYAQSEGRVLQYLGRSATNSTTDVLPRLDILNPTYGGQPVSTVLSTSTESEGSSLGLAVQEQAYLFKDRLILQAAVRHNRNESAGFNVLTRLRDTPPAKTKWTPRYGAVYRPIDGVAFYGSRSETFTPIFTANPDGRTFTPPTSKQDEIGVKLDLLGGKVSATVAHYKRSERNTIVQDPDPIRASAGYRVQIAGDELKGNEIDLYFSPLAGLQVLVGASKLDAKTLSGLRTRGVPDKQASVLAKYAFSAGPLKGLALGSGYTWRGRRAGDTGNTFWLPGGNLYQAFAAYGWRRYSLHLKVDNVTDSFYANNAVNRNIISLAPPRMVTLRVSREF
ncbi:MAG: TonB-dependent receptor [Opitutaceae bacterium]|nr:TonB-dependent receptor [Opitutaceae bacterium]